MSRVVSPNPHKELLRRPRRPRVERQGEVEGGHDARAGAERAGGSFAQNFERDYPQFNRSRGASARHPVRDAYARRRHQLEVQRDLRACSRSAWLAVAYTNAAGLLLSRARARTTRGIAVRLALGRQPLPSDPPVADRKPHARSRGRPRRRCRGLRGHHVPLEFSIPSELPVTIPFRMDTRVLIAALVLSVVSARFCAAWAPALQSTRADRRQQVEDGRRRRAGAQAPLGPQRAGRGAGLHVADALSASFLMMRSFEHSMLEGTDSRRITC